MGKTLQRSSLLMLKPRYITPNVARGGCKLTQIVKARKCQPLSFCPDSDKSIRFFQSVLAYKCKSVFFYGYTDD